MQVYISCFFCNQTHFDLILHNLGGSTTIISIWNVERMLKSKHKPIFTDSWNKDSGRTKSSNVLNLWSEKQAISYGKSSLVFLFFCSWSYDQICCVVHLFSLKCLILIMWDWLDSTVGQLQHYKWAIWSHKFPRWVNWFVLRNFCLLSKAPEFWQSIDLDSGPTNDYCNLTKTKESLGEKLITKDCCNKSFY